MRLLIVGTLGGQLTTATKIAMERGASVTHAPGTPEAMKVLRSGQGADLLMVDVNEDIGQLVELTERERIHVPLVACGLGTDARAAVSAIRAGAKEYIPLPPDPELIAAVLAAVTEEREDLIYRDAAMASVIKLAEQVAPSDASVLITGESGSGKEVISRFLHSKSNRADKPFISINCAAIPEHLLESELFGHEKGAFTGAVARRVGKFEEANGGTLMLDEISEMDVRLQAKLLRAIQERVIDRVGGSRPVPVDIRIIATSNRDLAEEVRAGTFREDLLYRLNVVNLKLPALRERPADILELASHFVEIYAKANGTNLCQSLRKGVSCCWRTNGKGTCASWKTPCTALFCSPLVLRLMQMRSVCRMDLRLRWARANRRLLVRRMRRKQLRATWLGVQSLMWSVISFWIRWITVWVTVPMRPRSSVFRSAHCVTS